MGMLFIIIELRKVQVNQAKILHDVHRIHHSSCIVGCNLCMWEDGTYLTSQSDDVDTSHGTRTFNMWTTAMRIAIRVVVVLSKC